MPCYIDVDIYYILGVSAVFKLVAPRQQLLFNPKRFLQFQHADNGEICAADSLIILMLRLVFARPVMIFLYDPILPYLIHLVEVKKD